MTSEHDIPISAEGLLVLTWTLNIIVSLLMYARIRLHRKQRLSTPAIIASDALLIVSWVCSIGSISTDAWKYAKEIKGRTQELSLFEKQTGPKLSYLCGYLVFSAMWSSKASYVAYYYHLFSNMSRALRLVLAFITAFTISTFSLIILIQALWCRPIWTNWTLDPSRSCGATTNPTTLPIFTFTNIATDLLLALFPLLIIRFLRMQYRDILALAFVFCVGFISIGAAIARFAVIYPKIKNHPKASIVHTYELWALVEITAGQIAVCLPSVRAHWRGWREKKGQKWEMESPGIEKKATSEQDGVGDLVFLQSKIGEEGVVVTSTETA